MNCEVKSMFTYKKKKKYETKGKGTKKGLEERRI